MILWILYSLCVIALIGIVSPSFLPVARKTSLTFQNRKEALRHSWLYQHIDTMLFLIKPTKSYHVARYFYYTGILFIATFVIAFLFTTEFPIMMSSDGPFVGQMQQIGNRGIGAFFSVLIAILAVMIQYITLRMRYIYRQIKAGYDLLDVVKTLPRFADLSTDEALLQTAKQLAKNNTLIKSLNLLSFSITNYTHEQELEAETKRFVAMINTTFAVAFISDLLFALRSGTPWRESLISLGHSMETRLFVIMDAKRSMSDAIHMGLWGNAVSLIGICGGLCYLIGWSVYAALQFQTFIGMFLLTINLAAIFVSALISLKLHRPALDYK